MYGNLKPKPRASFVKRNVESYPDDSTAKGKFIKRTLYTMYGKDIRRSKNRALKVLYSNDVILNEPPEWVKNVGTIVNTGKYTILGGGSKDIILSNDYAYTFFVTSCDEQDEQDNNIQYAYENHLNDLSISFEKLNDKVKNRLNYAKPGDIYGSTFKDNNGCERRVVITKVPLCSQGTLLHYIGTWGNKLDVTAFTTMVYETMKVLKILHDNDLYVLDIKPDNIFVCKDEREKGYDGHTFAFGDLDMAEICKEADGITECKSNLATLFFLPTNAIRNPTIGSTNEKMKQRNLHGKHGYMIRDAYALSKTLLVAFNLMFDKTMEIALFNENENFFWTSGEEYELYKSQGMTNKEWEEKMSNAKAKLILLAEKTDIKLVPIIDALFLLMYRTSKTGRPVENKSGFNRLTTWDEMIKIDDIDLYMDIAKDRASAAGAHVFTRHTSKVLPSRNLLNVSLDFMEEDVEVSNVQESSVVKCWKGSRRRKGRRKVEPVFKF